MPEFTVNSQILPTGFPREFDAHIYFGEESLALAEMLRLKAIEMFAGRTVFVGEMIPVAIGPHPLPMFEINFSTDMLTEVLLWLMTERESLSVLVHALTGDDLYDHTQAALWLGPQVALKYSVF